MLERKLNLIQQEDGLKCNLQLHKPADKTERNKFQKKNLQCNNILNPALLNYKKLKGINFCSCISFLPQIVLSNFIEDNFYYEVILR